jgi:hypothetical protein
MQKLRLLDSLFSFDFNISVCSCQRRWPLAARKALYPAMSSYTLSWLRQATLALHSSVVSLMWRANKRPYRTKEPIPHGSFVALPIFKIGTSPDPIPYSMLMGLVTVYYARTTWDNQFCSRLRILRLRQSEVLEAARGFVAHRRNAQFICFWVCERAENSGEQSLHVAESFKPLRLPKILDRLKERLRSKV